MPFDVAVSVALFLRLKVFSNTRCTSGAAPQGKRRLLLLCPFWERHQAEHRAGGPMCQQFQTTGGKAAS